MAVFIPVPPTGVVRCTASPTRKARPDRNAVATWPAMTNGRTCPTAGSRSGRPVAARSSSTYRCGGQSTMLSSSVLFESVLFENGSHSRA